MKARIDADGFVILDGSVPKGSRLVPKPPSTGMKYVSGKWVRPTPRHFVDQDGVYFGQIVSFDDPPSGLMEVAPGNLPPDGNHRLVDGGWTPLVPDAVDKLSLIQALPSDEWAKARSALRQNPDLEDRWIAASIIRRDAPEIAALGAVLKYSDQQVDDVFIAARGLATL